MQSKTWSPRFNKPLNEKMKMFNQSILFDYHLAKWDIIASIAHAKMLEKVGLFTKDELKKAVDGLEKILKQVDNNEIKMFYPASFSAPVHPSCSSDRNIVLLQKKPRAVKRINTVQVFDRCKFLFPLYLEGEHLPYEIDKVKDQELKLEAILLFRIYEIALTVYEGYLFFHGVYGKIQGLDFLEGYLRECREEVGYEIPLAIDHLGHIPLEDCIRLARRLEKYNLSWMEDALPWQQTELWKQLHAATTVPLGTGEDIYLLRNFKPLLDSGALAVVHPDLLTAGGIAETKKVGDYAEERGVQMSLHMAESPIAAMAAVHVAAATRNFMALEIHSVDVPWWKDLVNPAFRIENGFVPVPDAPGLGIESLNEALIQAHLHESFPEAWSPTDEWDKEWANDRRWS